MIYIYNSLSILLLGILLNKKLDSPKYKKIYLIFCFIQMILIQGLRDISVGTDTTLYVNTYNNYLHNKSYFYQFMHFEYGFQLLYIILQKMNMSSQQMLIIVSSLTMFGFAYFIYKNSKNVYISTFIFACMLYPNSFNIMRQYLAISIAINSYQFIINNKYIRGFILIFIGSLFHITAILMLIPLILNFVKNWSLIRNIIIVSSILCFIFGNQIVNKVLPILGKSFYLKGYNVDRLFRMTTLMTIIFSMLMFYFSNKIKEKEDKKELKLLTNIAFVNINFGILYLKYEFFSRVIEALNSFLIIGIPIGLGQIQSYYKILIKIGIYCLPFLLMLNAIYNSGSGIEFYKMYFMI